MFSLGFIFMVNDSLELSVIFVPLVLPEQTPMVEVLQDLSPYGTRHTHRPVTLLLFFQGVCIELRPRLCVIQRGANGYGFNLHSERARPGQYIRAVDEDSPAERAGLQPRDRIVQVRRIKSSYVTLSSSTLQNKREKYLVRVLLCYSNISFAVCCVS